MSKLLTVFLSLILIFQLVMINYSLTPSEFSSGLISERVFAKRDIPARRYQAAILTNDLKKNYDSMIFVGDVMLARNVEYLMQTKNENYPFLGLSLQSILGKAAIFGNFEASIPSVHEITPAGSLKFSVLEETASKLKNFGFSHLSLANNHSFDSGEEGYVNTVKVLEGEDIETFGSEYRISADSVSYTKVNNETVAVIGMNLLLNIEESDIESLFKFASSKSDFQIAYVHWGEEYSLYHDSSQERLAKIMIDSGADLIIGHHPHVTQGVGMIDGVPVIYSLGNYIFDQYFSSDVQEGLIIGLSLGDEYAIDLIPVSSIENKSQPNLMKAENHADFLAKLARKSDASLARGIENGRILLRESVASSSKMAIINQ